MNEATQRTLGGQRIVDASRPPSPKGPVRVNSYAQSLIKHYRDQVKDAKKNEKKLQELLRTRERDITQLRSLRSITFESPPTFYEETIQRLNNQLQMLRRDTWEHEEQKRLVQQREKGHAEVMKEKSRMHQRAIDAYSDLHKQSAAKYADYEASIKLREETESQLRHQLQEVTEELQTSRQTVSERVEELSQLRVLLREEAYTGPTTVIEGAHRPLSIIILPSWKRALRTSASCLQKRTEIWLLRRKTTRPL